MKRQISVFALCAMLFALSSSAQAQQPGKIARIGYLDGGTASGIATVLLDAFRHELSKFGWIEGRNFTIESRFSEEKTDRLAELAADLVRLKVDVIVCASTAAALAAKRATTTIPIVMANSADPVGAGLVASLARPGGNVTGLSGLASELNTKRLEILKDGPKARSSWTFAAAGKQYGTRSSTKRAQGCGFCTEAQIGGDRDSIRP